MPTTTDIFGGDEVDDDTAIRIPIRCLPTIPLNFQDSAAVSDLPPSFAAASRTKHRDENMRYQSPHAAELTVEHEESRGIYYGGYHAIEIWMAPF